MTDRYDLVVYGRPEPAGSKKHVGGHHIIDANPNAKAWKQQIAAKALDARDGRRPLEGPLLLRIVFFVARPKSHYGTGANAGRLKDTAPDWPTTRPDATKLTRAVEDALTGILYRDDGQIAEQRIRRIYVRDSDEPDEGPRTLISVEMLPPQIVPPIQW